MCRLRPLIFFPTINAALFARIKRFDALRIKNGEAGRRFSTLLLSLFLVQTIQNFFPGTILHPGLKIAVNTLPRWIFFWQIAPRTPRLRHIKNRIHNIAALITQRAAKHTLLLKKNLNQRPLFCPSYHSDNSPNIDQILVKITLILHDFYFRDGFLVHRVLKSNSTLEPP